MFIWRMSRRNIDAERAKVAESRTISTIPKKWPAGPVSARAREVRWLASSYGLPVGGPLSTARSEREFFGGVAVGCLTTMAGGPEWLADRAVGQTIRTMRALAGRSPADDRA